MSKILNQKDRKLCYLLHKRLEGLQEEIEISKEILKRYEFPSLEELNKEYKPEVNDEDEKKSPIQISDRSIGGPGFFSNHHFIEPNRPKPQE